MPSVRAVNSLRRIFSTGELEQLRSVIDELIVEHKRREERFHELTRRKTTEVVFAAGCLFQEDPKELPALRALVDECIADMGRLDDDLNLRRALLTSRNERHTEGYIEVKMIKGRPYRYLRYWRNGKLKSKYIGKVEQAAAT